MEGGLKPARGFSPALLRDECRPGSQRLFDLAGIPHKITGPLTAEHVPHELTGGLAVLVQVEDADPRCGESREIAVRRSWN
jgi:hypothetical protein